MNGIFQLLKDGFSISPLNMDLGNCTFLEEAPFQATFSGYTRNFDPTPHHYHDISWYMVYSETWFILTCFTVYLMQCTAAYLMIWNRPGSRVDNFGHFHWIIQNELLLNNPEIGLWILRRMEVPGAPNSMNSMRCSMGFFRIFHEHFRCPKAHPKKYGPGTQKTPRNGEPDGSMVLVYNANIKGVYWWDPCYHI